MIDRFCLASGARVNWNKSSGIILGTDARTHWGTADGFTWLLPRESCRYLGFQIGLDVTPAQQFTPVLDSIAAGSSLTGQDAIYLWQVELLWLIRFCWPLHGILHPVGCCTQV